ncbi:MAG TPA: hypothetical protein VF247_01690 [Candidatus Krumholzibacteria bacterium]
MRNSPRHCDTVRIVATLMLAIALGNGCTSYQYAQFADIKARPEQFTDKKLRVHYASSIPDTSGVHGTRTVRERRGSSDSYGATFPDSAVVTLRVRDLNYPWARGLTVSDPKLFGGGNPPDTVALDLARASYLEVEDFDSGRTALLLVGVALAGALIYELFRETGDSIWSWFWSTLTGD